MMLLPPANTMFVPLTVLWPAVLPPNVMNWLCAEFQSPGLTMSDAATVAVVAPFQIVTVPVASAIGVEKTCETAIRSVSALSNC